MPLPFDDGGQGEHGGWAGEWRDCRTMSTVKWMVIDDSISNSANLLHPAASSGNVMNCSDKSLTPMLVFLFCLLIELIIACECLNNKNSDCSFFS